jgi:hypothetical protein
VADFIISPQNEVPLMEMTLKQGANWVTAREPNGDKAEVADFIIPPQNEVKHLLMKMSQCVCILITSVIGLSV